MRDTTLAAQAKSHCIGLILLPPSTSRYMTQTSSLLEMIWDYQQISQHSPHSKLLGSTKSMQDAHGPEQGGKSSHQPKKSHKTLNPSPSISPWRPQFFYLVNGNNPTVTLITKFCSTTWSGLNLSPLAILDSPAYKSFSNVDPVSLAPASLSLAQVSVSSTSVSALLTPISDAVEISDAQFISSIPDNALQPSDVSPFLDAITGGTVWSSPTRLGHDYVASNTDALNNLLEHNIKLIGDRIVDRQPVFIVVSKLSHVNSVCRLVV